MSTKQSSKPTATTTATTTVKKTPPHSLSSATGVESKSTPKLCPNQARERELDNVLNALQKENNIKIFESKEMTEKRKRIIVQVKELTSKWIRKCLSEIGKLSKTQIESCSSYIRAFGSYELNAHFEHSDIDLLCIGPKSISRSMLFTSFVQMLQADERISDILVLEHAFVPLLKFTFCGVDIDLVYAQWNIDIINDDTNINVFGKNYVKDQDTLFSLNGVRSTQTIKKLIPNMDIFTKSLRIIKFWAQQRAIYSNVMGFLGGISWSIMTALVCIENPKADIVQILQCFFGKYYEALTFHKYDSIRLDESLYADMYTTNNNDNGGDEEEELTMLDEEDEYTRNEFAELMPILTPARPAMNCAYNVIAPTKYLIMSELKRAYIMTAQQGGAATADGDDADEAEHAQAAQVDEQEDADADEEGTGGCNINWNELFRKRHFVCANDDILSENSMNYDDENIYIRIQSVPDPKKLFCKRWAGFIESKIRNLVKKLNRDLFDSTFYPFANSIKCGNVDNFFIFGKYNIDFDHRANNEDAINMALQQFQNQIDFSQVRNESKNKCMLKLDVYSQNMIHSILKELNYDAPNFKNMQPPTHSGAHPSALPINTGAIPPQFQLLHNVNLLNGVGTVPFIPTPHTPQPPVPQQHITHGPRHQNHHRHGHGHGHHGNHRRHRNRYHHGPPPPPHHAHHHPRGHGPHPPPPPHHRQFSHQQPIYPNLAPIDIVVDPSKPIKIGKEDLESNEVEGLPNSNANDSNSASSGDTIPTLTTPSSASASASATTSSGGGSNGNGNNNNVMPSFPVPSLGNMSSFPIIKIQQQGLPHLPPFVTTQNGQTPSHYPLVTNQNFNSMRHSNVKFPPSHHPNDANNNTANGACQYWNSLEWAQRILLQNASNIESNKGNLNKLGIGGINGQTAEYNKENLYQFQPKTRRSSHKHTTSSSSIRSERVKMPFSFVKAMSNTPDEQFGYPSPRKISKKIKKKHTKSSKSTLIIHPAASNDILLQSLASLKIDPPKLNPNSKGTNEFLKSYQNYCNILNVFNINAPTANILSIPSLKATNTSNHSAGTPRTNDTNSTSNAYENNEINENLSHSTIERNNCYNSDFSSSTESEQSNDESHEMKESNTKKPLYSHVITADVTSSTTTTTVTRSRSSSLTLKMQNVESHNHGNERRHRYDRRNMGHNGDNMYILQQQQHHRGYHHENKRSVGHCGDGYRQRGGNRGNYKSNGYRNCNGYHNNRAGGGGGYGDDRYYYDERRAHRYENRGNGGYRSHGGTGGKRYYGQHPRGKNRNRQRSDLY